MSKLTDAEKIKYFDDNIDWINQIQDPLDIDMYNFDEVAKDFYFDFLKRWAEETGNKVPSWM